MIANSKGGSAKTTSVVSLAGAFADEGRRVLVIDLDPQGSATYWLGASESRTGLVEYSEGGRRVTELVRRTSSPRIDIIPTSPTLVPSGERSSNDTGLAIVRGFARLPDFWDMVLIDTPATVGYLSLAPLVASDHVVIPVEAHAIALTGVATVAAAIDRARTNVNRRVDLLGIIVCRVNTTVHSRDVFARLRGSYGSKVLEQTVRETIRVAEAPAMRMPITRYAPSSTAAHDYRAVAMELLHRMGSTATIV